MRVRSLPTSDGSSNPLARGARTDAITDLDLTNSNWVTTEEEEEDLVEAFRETCAFWNELTDLKLPFEAAGASPMLATAGVVVHDFGG